MTRWLWAPAPDRIEQAQMTAFLAGVRAAEEAAGHGGERLLDYPALYRWSIAHPDRFWPAVWRFCEVIAEERPGGEPWDAVVIGGDRMAPPDRALGPRWFPGARLNFAENLLRWRDAHPALVACSEEGRRSELSYAELSLSVAAAAAALRALGVGPGDRVAGFLPNIPEAVIGMLAAASVGAIWSSCSPDFGARGVLDRFGQIAPRVLICADGYRYAGKELESIPRVREIAAALPGLERVVVVPYLHPEPSLAGIPHAVRWDEFVSGASPEPPRFERFAFDHPLYIMYSSGTTGLPKCMVHGAGGTLLQHMKELVLHTDLRREDRIFYFTTCGWMMWNWLVSSLAVGATVVLYDGAALSPSPRILWEMAERERVTVFGTSAKYLALCEKEGLAPGRTHDLGALRAVLSTGSPLAGHSFDWVYASVKGNVQLASISGGTDIISCFALGNPVAPVWRGEIQTLGLGMAVDVADEAGHSVRGAAGELVCRAPFPSMPVCFWNDPDGARYRAAYFEQIPGVWRHGDWAELTEHDGLVIHGRSDATLNPGGVRIGTAEIYRQVDQIPWVVESLAVAHELGEAGSGETRIVLFVRLAPGIALDDAGRAALRQHIREHTSPHHVPRVIVQVSDLPRTISGKVSELAVREVIHGRAVTNVDALANPESLDYFRNHPELRG